MESLSPAGKDTAVAIAVMHDRRELWAVGGQGLSRGMDEGYKEILDIQTRENLLPLESYCKKKKIQNDLVIM
ncbi:hypothetical protein QQ045_006986 [Rhodiola kirilowii]